LLLTRCRNLIHLHSFPTRRSSDLKETLNKTPELLPVLKEAGVVDSGGAGFIKIIEGMMMALEGQILAEEEKSFNPQVKHEEYIRSEEHTSELQSRENLVCRLLLEK